MNKKKIETLTIIIIVCNVIFTVLSAFPCAEHWSRNTMIPVLAPGEIEGNVVKINNCFIFMLLLGIVEICVLLKSNFMKQKINIVIGIIRTVVTLWIPNIVWIGPLFGVIATDFEEYYKVTPMGYIVVCFSWLVLIFEIRLASLIRKCKKQSSDLEGI